MLEQKIEILEQQLAESKNREENITRMNQTIFSAINELNNSTNLPSRVYYDQNILLN